MTLIVDSDDIDGRLPWIEPFVIVLGTFLTPTVDTSGNGFVSKDLLGFWGTGFRGGVVPKADVSGNYVGSNMTGSRDCAEISGTLLKPMDVS